MEILQKYFSDFTEKQLHQLAQLGDLYKDWNEKINVISRKDLDNLYEKHILHSLGIATHFQFSAGTQILDLGTGGGFPGIPLAIYFPTVQFLLVDSIGKKLKVVENIAATIGLENITTSHSRVEDIAGQKFDFVVSRAVAPLKNLWGWARPLLKTGKQATVKNENAPGLICLKGGDLDQEISDSGLRPYLIDLHIVFNTDFFEKKHILYIPK